jgi:hypothetical protein
MHLFDRLTEEDVYPELDSKVVYNKIVQTYGWRFSKLPIHAHVSNELNRLCQSGILKRKVRYTNIYGRRGDPRRIITIA